jgi:transcriptional regulator with XRE-family HTH domain
MDRKELLGRRIQELRKARKLSQEAVAERAGISTQYVSNIERGKENPTLDMLFTLADTLRADRWCYCRKRSSQGHPIFQPNRGPSSL